MGVDEDTTRAVITGAAPWRTLLAAGVGLEIGANWLQVREPADQVVIHPSPSDMLRGIRHYAGQSDPRGIQDWARVIHACNFIEFDRFDTPAGDAVLALLWDAAFGQMPTSKQIAIAERLVAGEIGE